MAKAIECYPEIFTNNEKRKITRTISLVRERLIKKAYITTDGLPFWKYINGRSQMNDLIHHVFMLEGITNLRNYNYDSAWTWPVSREKKSIDCFIYNGGIFQYPKNGDNNEIADLYGLGGILQYYSILGEKEKSKQVLRFTLQLYPNLAKGIFEDARECTFFVKGLAMYNYGR